jgi:hypothetical protein
MIAIPDAALLPISFLADNLGGTFFRVRDSDACAWAEHGCFAEGVE